MKDKLLQSVKKLALRKVEKYYHSASNTHIYFQPHIGSLGVKGIGDFSDEAYANYNHVLIEFLERLSEEELTRSFKRLSTLKSGLNKVKEIQIQVPSIVKETLKEHAEQHQQALSDLIRSILSDQMPFSRPGVEVREWYMGITQQVRELEFHSDTANSKTSISVRLPEKTLSDFQDIAANLGTRNSSLMKSVVLAKFSAMEGVSAAVH